MERVNQILHHSKFIENLNRLETLEADRIYCHHGLSHLLDVARLASLLQYKKKENKPSNTFSFPDEIIYAAALLHDIGRVLQYEQGISHETAGLKLAEQILKDCGFTKSEQMFILDAIQFHRKADSRLDFGLDVQLNSQLDLQPELQLDLQPDSTPELQQHNGTSTEKALYLRSLLYNADKLSRNCFACAASDSCYWPESQKNHEILY